MTNWEGHGGSWSNDAPVFDTNNDLTFDGKTYTYPDVWITRQWYEPTDESTGRACVWHYTPNTDEGGWDALDYGGEYYDEGMACDPEGEHQKRIMCFQAAELLYLHSAKLGNPLAHLCLGYVYAYDRCEGKYWGYWEPPYTRDDVPLGQPRTGIPYPHEERAYEHFRTAAEADVAEACYKLGDMLRNGRGCDKDLDEAFRWFSRAYELGRDEPPVIWGSAALRLGQAFEEGEGCDQSFDEALTYYERAETGLGIAVRSGSSWYRGALQQARQGLARIRQELDGGY